LKSQDKLKKKRKERKSTKQEKKEKKKKFWQREPHISYLVILKEKSK
jgi:hypothetical protein